jgi:hypothetical protein
MNDSNRAERLLEAQRAAFQAEGFVEERRNVHRWMRPRRRRIGLPAGAPGVRAGIAHQPRARRALQLLIRR